MARGPWLRGLGTAKGEKNDRCLCSHTETSVGPLGREPGPDPEV